MTGKISHKRRQKTNLVKLDRNMFRIFISQHKAVRGCHKSLHTFCSFCDTFNYTLLHFCTDVTFLKWRLILLKKCHTFQWRNVNAMSNVLKDVTLLRWRHQSCLKGILNGVFSFLLSTFTGVLDCRSSSPSSSTSISSSRFGTGLESHRLSLKSRVGENGICHWTWRFKKDLHLIWTVRSEIHTQFQSVQSCCP